MIEEASLVFKYSRIAKFIIRDSKSKINKRDINNNHPNNWRLLEQS